MPLASSEMRGNRYHSCETIICAKALGRFIWAYPSCWWRDSETQKQREHRSEWIMGKRETQTGWMKWSLDNIKWVGPGETNIGKHQWACKILQKEHGYVWEKQIGIIYTLKFNCLGDFLPHCSYFQSITNSWWCNARKPLCEPTIQDFFKLA